MKICFTINGVKHCYYIPVFAFPISLPHNGLPQNFPELFVDATVIASIHAATRHISDEGVRGAVEKGVQTAVGALQKRAGEHVEIQLGQRAG
jgi:hypothetical protein